MVASFHLLSQGTWGVVVDYGHGTLVCPAPVEGDFDPPKSIFCTRPSAFVVLRQRLTLAAVTLTVLAWSLRLELRPHPLLLLGASPRIAIERESVEAYEGSAVVPPSVVYETNASTRCSTTRVFNTGQGADELQRKVSLAATVKKLPLWSTPQLALRARFALASSS